MQNFSIGDPDRVNMLLPNSCRRVFNVASLVRMYQLMREFMLTINLDVVPTASSATCSTSLSNGQKHEKSRGPYVYELSTRKLRNCYISFFNVVFAVASTQQRGRVLSAQRSFTSHLLQNTSPPQQTAAHLLTRSVGDATILFYLPEQSYTRLYRRPRARRPRPRRDPQTSRDSSARIPPTAQFDALAAPPGLALRYERVPP
jgi:hypothetical protein